MCGIAGYLQLNQTQLEPAIIQQMLALIAHRGPDGQGYFIDDRAALGNSRLSIIDLAGGDQPIGDASGRYWIVYNGELYNYIELRCELIDRGCHFQTTCDTEVLLYGWITWGESVLQRLNGAFAFAIYDRQTGDLFLARDRFGLRPLYYGQTDQAFVFASEQKALLAHPAISFALDPARVARIFTLWTPPVQETPFAGLHQLPPGHGLTIRNKNVNIKSYYSLDFARPIRTEDRALLAEEVRQQLTESVRLRSRSDVEVGVYLSGGLDSAIVTRLAQEQCAHPIRSFSLAFEDAAFDERTQQDLLSDHLGTEHTRLTVRHADIATAFTSAVWHAEVPLFRTALVPMLLLAEKVQAHGIKVVMTGEGADESFLGYNIFKETALRANWQTLSAAKKEQIIGGLYPYLHHFGKQNYGPLLSMYNRSLAEQSAGLFSHQMRFTNAQFGVRLLKDTGTNPLVDLSAALHATTSGSERNRFDTFSPLQKAQWLEFKTLLAGYLLSSQGDRMSLAHGVENRCPFLDHNVVEFAATLPESLKLNDYVDEKHLLKEAFRADLPAAIVARPKQPYRAPDAAVFQTHRPDYLELILSPRELEKSGLIDTAHATRFVRKVLNLTDSSNGNSNGISPRENQAFIQLLSLQLLHHFFVERKLPVAVCETQQFTKIVDLRRQPVYEYAS